MSILSESGLLSLNSSIQTNLYELERLIKELENCAEALKKAIHLHLYLSCNSSIHSKDCLSLRNAKSTLKGLAEVSSKYPNFTYVNGDNGQASHLSLCLADLRSNIMKQFHRSCNRTKSLCSWKELHNLKENYIGRNSSLDETTDAKNYADNPDTQLSSESKSTTQQFWEENNSSSFCEILQVAQDNLDDAVLAIKEYELVAWDISSVMGTEEKVILIRAKELRRKADVFDKMTETALEKLNNLSYDDDSQENVDDVEADNTSYLSDNEYCNKNVREY
jgi:hypothetical protein